MPITVRRTTTIPPRTGIDSASRNGRSNTHLVWDDSTPGVRFMSAADPRDRTADPGQDAPEAVRDPVCGMSVDPAATPHRAEHGGQRYFFCGANCRARF